MLTEYTKWVCSVRQLNILNNKKRQKNTQAVFFCIYIAMKKILTFLYPNKDGKNRLYILDNIRGFTVLNMILYHALYDAVYLCSFKITWYEGKAGLIWEFLICSVFILLSGLCMNLSSHPYKRGLTVFLSGLIVSAVTLVFIPEEKILFGVLTFLGCAMLFTALISKLLNKVNPVFLLILNVLLFIFTFNINNGYVGFFNLNKTVLPSFLYKGYFMTFLGFTDLSFFSSDYFSFIPWIFLFISGYAFGKIVDIKSASLNVEKGNRLLSLRIPVLTFIGQRALLIYLIHQPLLYLIVLIINRYNT